MNYFITTTKQNTMMVYMFQAPVALIVFVLFTNRCEMHFSLTYVGMNIATRCFAFNDIVISFTMLSYTVGNWVMVCILLCLGVVSYWFIHDDVIKWKHFPRYWPFVRGIHRSPVNSPHKGQWRGALMFSLIYAWINDWVNNCEAGDLRRQRGHYDVI